MVTNGVYTEEGRVKRASGSFFVLIFAVSFILGSIAAYNFFNYQYKNFSPYQRLNYPQFQQSFTRQFTSFKKNGNYFLLTHIITDPKTKAQTEYLWREEQLDFALDEDGNIKFNDKNFPVASIKPERTGDPGISYFREESKPNAEVYRICESRVEKQTSKE